MCSHGKRSEIAQPTGGECRHLMILVPSARADAEKTTRRVCTKPGCGYDEFLSPEQLGLLVWHGPDYGTKVKDATENQDS